MHRNALRGAALASMCAAVGMISCETAPKVTGSTGTGGTTSSSTTGSTTTTSVATTTTTTGNTTTTSSSTGGGFCVLDTAATLDQCKLQ